MPKQKNIVTGTDLAWVNCKDGIVRSIPEGDEIPEVDAGELARLKDAGVFGDHPRVEYRAHLQRLKELGLASNLAPEDDVERSAEEQSAAQVLIHGDNSLAVPDVGDVPPASPETVTTRRSRKPADEGASSAKPADAAAAREAAMGDAPGTEE